MIPENVARTFWMKVERRGTNECWPWMLSSQSRGYGQVGWQAAGRTVMRLAHRLAYEMVVGPIPRGLQLDHRCHSEAVARGECDGGEECPHRRCCNPRHLEVVTPAENTRRGVGGFLPQTHCQRGHEFTPENTILKAGGKWKECRTCSNARKREWRERQRLVPA